MSILKTIFSNSKYHIPVVLKSDDFSNEVAGLLADYINDIRDAGASLSVVQSVEKFRYSCKFVFSNYFKGIHSNAFKNFENALNSLDITDSRLLSTTLETDILFRGRENKDSEDYSDDQMYHIPLNRRGVVSTQRYSFPGLPCLYVGASVYTCWVEMNRPSLDSFQVATIRPKAGETMRLLDLSNIPQRIGELEGNSWFVEDDYLLYWPLLALCSIKVNHENDPFKPEYIFPQFLLEHILKSKKDNEIVGIKYASIKVASICQKQFQEDWHTYVNYVFPVRSDNTSEEKCEVLKERFAIEQNHSGKELQIISRLLEHDSVKEKWIVWGGTPSDEESFKAFLKQRRLYTRDGKPYSYLLSVFGASELAMFKDGYDDITE